MATLCKECITAGKIDKVAPVRPFGDPLFGLKVAQRDVIGPDAKRVLADLFDNNIFMKNLGVESCDRENSKTAAVTRPEIPGIKKTEIGTLPGRHYANLLVKVGPSAAQPADDNEILPPAVRAPLGTMRNSKGPAQV